MNGHSGDQPHARRGQHGHRHRPHPAISDAAILEAVSAGRAEAVELLCELVSEDSQLGQETGAQDRMEHEFRALGLEVDRFGVDLEAIRELPGYSPAVLGYEGRENVVGVHRPQQARGRSLILNGHIDVVPAGPLEMWTTPPFQPAVREGRVYGRGAGDMKAGIVACVAALRALHALGVQPAAPLYLQSVIEEECTGNGALACLQRGYRADAAIIPEPFNHALMNAQLGVMWLTVTVRGRPVHVFEAQAGVNAIEAAFEIYSALKRLEIDWNRAEHRHPAFADNPHPVNFNLGRIEGGEWASSVPCMCRMDLRVAFYPGADLGQVRAALEHVIQDTVGARPEMQHVDAWVEYRGFQAEGCVVDTDSELMRQLAEVHGQVTGLPAQHVASTACTDVRCFSLYGDIPATCYGPEATRIHGIDESVSIDSMQTVAGVLAVFMARWCGLEQRG